MKIRTLALALLLALAALGQFSMPAHAVEGDGYWIEGRPQWWWKYVYPGGYPPHWGLQYQIVDVRIDGPQTLPTGGQGIVVTMTLQNNTREAARGGQAYQLTYMRQEPTPVPWRPSLATSGRLPSLAPGQSFQIRSFLPAVQSTRSTHFLTLAIDNAPTTTSLSGRIALQESVNLAQDLQFHFLMADGSVIVANNARLSGDGTVRILDVPTGLYRLAIKGPKWLQQFVRADLIPGVVARFEGSLRGGDANNDNAVDALDLADLISAFNTTLEDRGYNPRADFDGDGSVDALDLAILIRNFNTEGDD